MAVVHLVAALVTAYRDGADLVLALRERRWARGQAQHFPAEQRMLDDLEMVMARGSDAVQNQYERHNNRLGEAFATGDQIARDAMNNLVIHLQKRLMSRLKIAWQQDTHVDPHPLLEIAEDVQDRAIMCLMQLNQRLSAQEPASIMERSRPKLKKHKTTSSLHQHPYDTGAIPGAPEGFIDAHPPVPSHSNLFGYHVEITGPAPVELDTKTPERFVSNGKNVRQDSMESEPRIQHAPSFHSGYIPIDFSDEDVAQHWPEPPSAKHFQQRFADSPTLSPARLSSIGSMSSAGSREFEDLEHNPWSSHGAGSPLSSFDGSCSPAKSPYAPSLVPDALAPRRTNSGEHMQRKEAAPKAQNLAESMRQMHLDSQLRNDSTASSGIQPPLYLDDGLSMGNEPDRYQNKSPSMMSTINFVASSNPFEPTRNHYQNMQAPTPTRPLPPSSSEQQSQRAPTYSWLPRTSPVPQTSMSNLRARQLQQRQATPPIGELEEPAYRPAPMSQRSQEPSYRQMQPTAPMPVSNHRAYQQQAASPPRQSPPRYSPPQQLAIPANVTAYKWDMPNSPPRTAPIPPMRAPERESVLPTPRRDTAHSMAMTSSSGSIVVLPPPPTPGPQSAPVQSSFHLANKRVSTVSSSGSSGSGGPRPPPVPMPAMRTIPSSAPPGNAKACMPNEKNKFAGFCKGAWRGQIGDQKKAYEDRSRPAGIGTNKMLNYYKCKKCNFEGRAKRDANGKSICPDNKVYGSNGILYRWEFLFKSHIESKGSNGSPLDASYGCMFCCAAGRGTPIFAGVASLMNHLQEHRHVLPQGEIIYRMNAIVGRSPDPEEDFDVALPSLVI